MRMEQSNYTVYFHKHIIIVGSIQSRMNFLSKVNKHQGLSCKYCAWELYLFSVLLNSLTTNIHAVSLWIGIYYMNIFSCFKFYSFMQSEYLSSLGRTMFRQVGQHIKYLTISRGHGVRWSPIIPYVFPIPDGWEEVRMNYEWSIDQDHKLPQFLKPKHIIQLAFYGMVSYIFSL